MEKRGRGKVGRERESFAVCSFNILHNSPWSNVPPHPICSLTSHSFTLSFEEQKILILMKS
jgi:hypothetical protein